MKRTLSILALLLCATQAFADNVGRDAGKHFQRGVDLYGDGDFRGALVEFKRAYTMLPRSSVLYDIGETQFQLQEYAAALGTMRRFLAETGPTAAHRPEVEATVEQLRGRVGLVSVGVDVARCEVAIDDEPVGPTPLEEPVAASVGTRKLSVACPERPVETRRVDVTAGEVARVELHIAPIVTQAPSPTAPQRDVSLHRRRTQLGAAWTSTVLLGAGLIGVGTTSLVEASQLSKLRQTYPVQASAIDQKASTTRGLSIAADVLGVATLAGVGLSTYLTLRYRKERTMQLTASPRGAGVRGTF